MIRVYRLCPVDRGSQVWSGDGGIHRDGRWHRRGRPIVYTASSVSLSQLEVLAHVSRQTKPLLSLAVADIPENVLIKHLNPRDLPKGWDNHPPTQLTADLGNRWLSELDTAVFCVPSVMSPESNYLLNPQHPDYSLIEFGKPTAFSMDGRLYQ